jgi:hypothetical protein
MPLASRPRIAQRGTLDPYGERCAPMQSTTSCLAVGRSTASRASEDRATSRRQVAHDREAALLNRWIGGDERGRLGEASAIAPGGPARRDAVPHVASGLAPSLRLT